jgi:hypothetical protein
MSTERKCSHDRDDETCIIFSNESRIALIKLLGSMSRDDYAKRRLTEFEILILEGLYYKLQT